MQLLSTLPEGPSFTGRDLYVPGHLRLKAQGASRVLRKSGPSTTKVAADLAVHAYLTTLSPDRGPHYGNPECGPALAGGTLADLDAALVALREEEPDLADEVVAILLREVPPMLAEMERYAASTLRRKERR